jgi:trk system potassium uptake protein TrkA
MQDIEIGDDFALVKTTPNSAVVGKPLGEPRIRSKYGVTVTAYKPAGRAWDYTTADTAIQAGDTILVAGSTRKAEAFSQVR